MDERVQLVAAYRIGSAGLLPGRGAGAASDGRVEPVHVHDSPPHLRRELHLADGFGGRLIALRATKEGSGSFSYIPAWEICNSGEVKHVTSKCHMLYLILR